MQHYFVDRKAGTLSAIPLAITLKPFHCHCPQNSWSAQPQYIKSSIETNIGRQIQQPNSVKRYWRPTAQKGW
ncbi:hypothetical protein FS595_01245 [Serratia rubidaea]|nr:hypothetical protein D2U14_15470 [Lacticaseibacillus paracasei]UJD78415.1 hypothetical protein FS596_01245 [Serratia rubidaea]UJD82966.1 hypothetical protein FS595_01245 [Serratia rubidaea]